MTLRLRLSCALAGLAAAGCTSPRHDDSAEAADAARRAERLKLMQEYWYAQTESPAGTASQGGEPSAALDYPAGDYGGLNFGPRRAANPSLEEPTR